MKINSRVVSDTFENEIVVVNLQNGFYYSFRNSAAAIWKLIEDQEASRGVITKAFEQLKSGEEKEVMDFLDILIGDGLVVDSVAYVHRVNNLDMEDGSRSTTEGEHGAPQKGRLLYSKLEYSKFEDMADLIMIDPIHEADANKGWPEKPA